MPASPTPPTPPAPTPSPAPAGALNVLMIAMDDLRPIGQAFGEPEALMPNLDALAGNSTIFTQAYAQAATCGVSRSSLLTSRRPDTTEVLSNGG
jgi:iduronate 2-sulfatase